MNAPRKLDLKIGVKPEKFWRVNDPNFAKANAEFDGARDAVLRARRFTCAGCDFRSVPDKTRPSGHIEVHHLDNNHANNSPANLVPVCPLCHRVFHIGLSGAVGNDSDARTPVGRIILLPQISQADLIRMVRTIGVATVLEGHPYEDAALQLYDQIEEVAHNNALLFGDFTGDPSVFGAYLQSADKQIIDQMETLAPDLRFLPNPKYFSEAIVYWAENVYAKTMPIAKWETLV